MAIMAVNNLQEFHRFKSSPVETVTAKILKLSCLSIHVI